MMGACFWGAVAEAGELDDFLAAGERLHEDDLQSIRGRGVVSSGPGEWQGDASRIILWDEAKNPGVITYNQSLGYGSTQSTTLSVKTY